jgi:FkbM family methyltransferase
VLIPVEILSKVWQVKPSGVLHVGAHEAEELEDYERFNWGQVIWVEAQPDKAEKLEKRLATSVHTVIHGAAWDVSGEILDLNIASNGQSTSLLDLGTHATSYPEIIYVEKIQITTSRLDELIPENADFNFANFDVQGTELNCIKGLGNLIQKADWIYTEVNKKEVYKNCTLVSELDAYLESCGFVRVDTRWVRGKGWGDALYARATLKHSLNQRLQALNERARWHLAPVKDFYPFLRHGVSKILKPIVRRSN